MKIEVIERIEGEAYLVWEKGSVRIIFESGRGMENLLKGRPLWDALVVTPRVCGICGHAHLAAAVEALEDLFNIEPTKKAKTIRFITRSCEIVQNHLKWFYLTIFPLVRSEQKFLQIHPAIVATNALIALFAGQWPHSSYMIPGGVTCDPSSLELLKAKGYVQQIKSFFYSKVLQDLKMVQEELKNKGIESIGRSYDRFIILSQRQKLFATRSSKIDLRHITMYAQPKSVAFGVQYKGRHYETGPLARMMLRGESGVRKLHRRHKDSIVTRISARVLEIGLLLEQIDRALGQIDLSEPSWIEAPKRASGEGVGVVEAARGSLMHRVVAKDGVIEYYEVLTPTQWNLANGSHEEIGVAVKAIENSPKEWSELVFKSFDVCSVCTTH